MVSPPARRCRFGRGRGEGIYVQGDGRDDTGNTESATLYIPDLALDADIPSGAWIIGHKSALKATGGNDT